MSQEKTIHSAKYQYQHHYHQPTHHTNTFDSINKLYSSERLTHHDLSSASTNKPEFSASQLFTNLTSSLDGLFSKIEAIKEEHSGQQQISKSTSRKNIDVSGFPMPNLANNTFLKKFPVKPTTTKAITRQKSNELNNFTDDCKAVSPPSQSIYYGQKNYLSSPKNFSSDYFDNKNDFSSFSTNQYSPKKKLIDETSIKNTNVYGKEIGSYKNQDFGFQKSKLTPFVTQDPYSITVKSVKNFQTSAEQPDYLFTNFSKSSNSTPNYLSVGLMNVPNLKISMEIKEDDFEPSFNEQNRPLKLDQIISKEADERYLVRKSVIFNQCTLRDFELGKLVGSGKFGDVHICRHKATGTMFALKKVFKSTIIEYNMVNQFTRELKIHYRLDHPHVIKLYTHFNDEYHVFLLMEYAEGGILMDKLKCAEDMASHYVEQTIEAVQYLHKLKIAHRDIKPQNIVLQFGNFVKLCDFGWSSYYENEMKTTFCGTLDYLSPEMKQGGQYDNSVDIWSIGVLTYELLTGSPPYRKELMLSMKNGFSNKAGSRKVNWEVNYPSYLSPLSESFIRNLLKEDPLERATLRFCSNHTFIKKYRLDLQLSQFFEEFNKII